jgi:DNA polymerase-1
MELPYIIFDDYEADDIVGSLVAQYKDQFDEVQIASGDKDLMQFVDDNVTMLDTMKSKIYDRKAVHEKMGVWPEQIVDYLTLVGDTSDNIPGVRGIGAKGAATLLEEYKTLDNMIENIESITTKRAKTALEKGIDQAELSKKLVQIKTDIKLPLKPQDFEYSFNPSSELIELLTSLNFKSTINKLKATPGAVDIKDESTDYIVVKDLKKWAEVLEELEGEDQASIEFFFTDDNYHGEHPELFALSLFEKNYIIYPGEDISFYEALSNLNHIPKLKLVSSNIKPILRAIHANVDTPKLNLFDLSQAHFVLNPDLKHDLEFISEEFIYKSAPTLKELRKENFEDVVSRNKIESSMAKRASVSLRSYPWLEKKLKERNLGSIYYEIDAPLIDVLAKMEQEGILLDTQYYGQLEKEYSRETDKIMKEITQIAGEEVNLRSPKQVGALLFDKLELPVIKKQKQVTPLVLMF